jgi:hypothetical protein
MYILILNIYKYIVKALIWLEVIKTLKSKAETVVALL